MKRYSTTSIFLAALVCSIASADESPTHTPREWLGNDLGREEVVLPGYEPLVVSNTQINLSSERHYEWRNSYLPQTITARNTPLISTMRLVIKQNGKAHELAPSHNTMVEATATHAVMVAEGTIFDSLQIKTTSRVEYDGVAFVEVTLTPQQPIQIDGLEQITSLVATDNSQVIAYRADSQVSAAS